MLRKEQYNEESVNPLDSVEEVLMDNDWHFNRMTDTELMVRVNGKATEYALFFIWQADLCALQFCCQYDLVIDDVHLEHAHETVREINENLWMGHFDIPKDTRIPSFRHTCLLRGMAPSESGAEHIEDLVNISLSQCERYYAALHILSQNNQIDNDNFSLALMDVSGEA